MHFPSLALPCINSEVFVDYHAFQLYLFSGIIDYITIFLISPHSLFSNLHVLFFIICVI